MPEEEVKMRAIELAEIKTGDKILDYGCGTGTLCNLIADCYPRCELVGIDVDSEILGIAKEKKKGTYKLEFFDGQEIPNKANTYDKVFATWVFHHLTDQQKIISLKEIYRVLETKGVFVIADWGQPISLMQSVLFFMVRLIDNFDTFRTQKEGKFIAQIENVGFTNVKIAGYRKTSFGTLYYYVIRK